MAEYQEPQIVDQTPITVKEASLNAYGDLIVRDTGGGECKIAKKRSALFPIFQVGNDVMLSWAEYLGKKYVVKAELIKSSPPQSIPTPTKVGAEPPPKKPSPPQDVMSKEDWAEKDKIVRRSIEKQKSLEVAGRLAEVGKIVVDKVPIYAEVYYRWLNGQLTFGDGWDVKIAEYALLISKPDKKTEP